MLKREIIGSIFPEKLSFDGEQHRTTLKKEKNTKEKAFFKSFGAFPEGKSAEAINEEIKASRTFRNKDLKF